jgi:hypothetical protein
VVDDKDMNLPDPLIPLPDEVLQLPENLSAEERLNAAIEAGLDHANLHAMAWPARDVNGNLKPPPDDHVLHDLAHAYDLVDEERLAISPRLGDVAVVLKLSGCDICGESARYDAILRSDEKGADGNGGGAYLCPVHYLQLGSGTLGASGDAYLMLRSEVPRWVQTACNELLAAQQRDPLF